MFNIGFGEMLLLGIIALVFIGPEQLPQLARTLGRLLNEWKRATSDLQSTFTGTFTEDINRHLQGGLQNQQPQNSYEQNPTPPDATHAQAAAATPPEATHEPAAAPTSSEPNPASAETAQNTIHTPTSASTEKKENNS